MEPHIRILTNLKKPDEARQYTLVRCAIFVTVDFTIMPPPYSGIDISKDIGLGPDASFDGSVMIVWTFCWFDGHSNCALTNVRFRGDCVAKVESSRATIFSRK